MEQLATNANPTYLSNCARDMACTQVSCQGSGVLSGRVESAIVALAPCEMPPGIIVRLVQSGTDLVNQLITAPTTILYDAGIATVNIDVFVNSTANSIGILVSFELHVHSCYMYSLCGVILNCNFLFIACGQIDPVTITAFFGTTTDYLVSFTSVQLNKSSCIQTSELLLVMHTLCRVYY